MARENAAAKARRYLSEGRVVLTRVDHDRAAAVVRGDGRLHHVSVRGPEWACTCEARSRCSHMIAVGLVVAVDYPEGPR